jgi:sugar phosphate isomerase/epimerase
MRITLQLYTLRDRLAQDLRGTLEQVKAIGIDYVELAGDYGKSAQEWRTLLDELGLKASGSHIGVDALEKDLDKVIADAKTLGLPYVIVPWVGKERYSEGWDKFGKALEPFGQRLRQEGITLCYHNHAFEFEGGNGLTALYAAADPSALQAEIDAAWVKIGGEDPAETIRSLKGRVPLVHLKDFDTSKQPQWTPAGQGTLDYDAVLAACQEAGVQFGGIELDESPGDALEAVRESFAFLSSRGLS